MLNGIIFHLRDFQKFYTLLYKLSKIQTKFRTSGDSLLHRGGERVFSMIIFGVVLPGFPTKKIQFLKW